MGAAPSTKALASVSLQQSALIVQGPQEVKKRELVFLQFRLNQSKEDFSAIDYLLFSSFREFMQRWLLRVHGVPLSPALCMSMLEMGGGQGRKGEQSWPRTGATLRSWWPITLSAAVNVYAESHALCEHAVLERVLGWSGLLRNRRN